MTYIIRKTRISGLLICLGLTIPMVIFAMGACAQATADGPSILEQRIKPKPTAPLSVDIPLPKKAPKTGPEPSASATIILTGVQIDGAIIYSEAELAAIYEPFLGQLFSEADAEKVVAAITAKYRGDGYVLARASAQPQDLAYGILHVDVAEGFIERVVFEGPVEARRSLLTEFAEKLKAARPLTQGVLERYVMLMGDLPGFKAQPALRTLDEASGAHELVLQLSQDDFEGYASIDNKSTRVVGRHIAQISGRFNSLFGQYGRTALYFYTVPEDNRELLFLEGQQEFTVNSEGTLLGLDGWHSVVESGERQQQFDQDSYDTRAAIYLVHPLIRGNDRSLFVTGTFEYRNTKETFAGFTNFDDRLRSARLTVRGFFKDDLDGENVIITTASQGLDILNASSNDAADLSRNGGKSDYAKLEGYYTRYQNLPGLWSAEFGLKGQLVSDGALSAEEFRAGGGSYGRAYDPSEISGDNGAGGYLELQRNLASHNQFFRSTQMFAFYDLAAAWNDDPIFGTSKISIASLGIGVRALLPNNVRVFGEIAQPLTEPVFAEGAQGDKFRFFFGLNIGF
ncbi:MAG: ShlB/FhaC/HecB family hemolysin secretion/activation protein [Rhodospirillaceae bacterium]|nr:ShlB/FhaC/HecB family hemolysin secretion/activation protein [Rhodospirillaceae bacterium]MBT4486183.1 ShlB/FhaC/HecB family hemolysin secretion/activation protein [Rhodospirillaceae bacterium]